MKLTQLLMDNYVKRCNKDVNLRENIFLTFYFTNIILVSLPYYCKFSMLAYIYLYIYYQKLFQTHLAVT